MLTELMPNLQQAWLAKAVSAIQPNDQMHLPAPQDLLAQWTRVACADEATSAEYAYNLAKYWCHGLRFPAHGKRSRNNLQKMLEQQHLKEHALRAADALLAAELQPLRIVRLWAFIHDVLPQNLLVRHIERLLTGPLPTGKKLKISQIDPDKWAAWLLMQPQLTPAAFKAGLELHVRANLTSRQDVDPHERSTHAWDMLNGCEPVLPMLTETFELTGPAQPCLLSVLVQYADSQTLRHLPWAAIQEKFVANPQALQCVWQHLYVNHKNVLLAILPEINKNYHAQVLQWFLDMPDFSLADERCLTVLSLVSSFPSWTPLLRKMLDSKDGYRTLGRCLLAVPNPQLPPLAKLMPGAYFSQLTARQWHQIFAADGKTSFNAQHLFQIWELVRVHKLNKLAAAPWLKIATMEYIPRSITRLNKVSAWDVSLGLPAFYASMLQSHLLDSEQEAWFNDWIEKPSMEKMVVQAFRCFNPTIAVPPMGELQLLAQALDNKATIVDVLCHLSQPVETFELPSMLES